MEDVKPSETEVNPKKIVLRISREAVIEMHDKVEMDLSVIPDFLVFSEIKDGDAGLLPENPKKIIILGPSTPATEANLFRSLYPLEDVKVVGVNIRQPNLASPMGYQEPSDRESYDKLIYGQDAGRIATWTENLIWTRLI